MSGFGSFLSPREGARGFTIEGLCVRLDGADVLKDVFAGLEPGTVTAICGPNGAGKSTLLSALAGLVVPRSGAALLDGQPVLELDPRERAKRIGYLPQSGEIAWDMSVRNLIALGRLPHGDSGHGAVDRAIAACGLVDFADRPVSTLSGGEKARALLARVLAGEPGWIMADEPLAALDLGHQLALLAQFKAVAAAGAGVVLVLHDLALAMNHADRVVVLDGGQVASDGSPSDALTPETIARVWGVTARWLGEPGARALAVG